jgi:hypothetical protein
MWAARGQVSVATLMVLFGLSLCRAAASDSTASSGAQSAGSSATTESLTTPNLIGQVLLGPACPDVASPPPARCADRPLETELVIATEDGATEVARVRSDASGTFAIALPPGIYLLEPLPPGAQPYPRAAPQIVTVELGTETHVVVMYDTGVR